MYGSQGCLADDVAAGEDGRCVDEKYGPFAIFGKAFTIRRSAS